MKTQQQTDPITLYDDARPHSAQATKAWQIRLLLKCLEHHEEDNQKTASTKLRSCKQKELTKIHLQNCKLVPEPVFFDFLLLNKGSSQFIIWSVDLKLRVTFLSFLVATKWVREQGQEFRRRCALSETEWRPSRSTRMRLYSVKNVKISNFIPWEVLHVFMSLNQVKSEH